MLEYLLTNVERTRVATFYQINLFLLMLTLHLFEGPSLLASPQVKHAVLTVPLLPLPDHSHSVLLTSTAHFGVGRGLFRELSLLFFLVGDVIVLHSEIRIGMVPRAMSIILKCILFLLLGQRNFESNELALTVIARIVIRYEAPVVSTIT